VEISELRKAFNDFVANLPSHVETIVNYNEQLEQLNRDQLQESTLASGQKISRSYSPSYAAWKSQFYPQSFGSGDVNLLLTGDLYKSTEIIAKYPKEYKVMFDVPYALKLAKKYGDFAGIAPKNQPKAQQIVINGLRELLQRQLK